jgi:hypothetical protein
MNYRLVFIDFIVRIFEAISRKARSPFWKGDRGLRRSIILKDSISVLNSQFSKIQDETFKLCIQL